MESTWLRVCGVALMVVSVGWLFGAWPTPEEERTLGRSGAVADLALRQAKQTTVIVTAAGVALGLTLFGVGRLMQRQERLLAHLQVPSEDAR